MANAYYGYMRLYEYVSSISYSSSIIIVLLTCIYCCPTHRLLAAVTSRLVG